jgi:hypothetical protein
MSWLKQEGEEDGIKWVVDWINGWDITVTKGDLVEHENIGGYEPRCGVDVLDLNRIEETLDKLITKLKKENFITKLKRSIKKTLI